MKRLTGDPRTDAAIIVDATLRDGARSTDLVNTAVPYYRDQRDLSLLRELVGGCLRRRMALEAVVAPHLKRGIENTRPLLREILLGHAYQLLFLDRIPTHARVSGAVDAARRLDGEKGAGFANAVARSVERAVGDDPGRLLAGMPLELRLSIPPIFMDLIVGQGYAAEDGDELERLAMPSPVAVRVPRDPDRLARALGAFKTAGTTATPGRWAPDCRILDSGRVLSSDAVPSLLIPQDEASQLVACAVMPQPGDRIVDLCCGTGVKTSQLMDMVPGTDVLGIDVDTRKLDRCKELCIQSGLGKPRVRGADATELPAEFDNSFDRVLLDAPCTGAGTLRRRPEVRYTRTSSDFERAARLQEALLERAIRLLVPGGRLVYAVCSFARQEGIDVVRSVLSSHPELVLVPTGLDDSLQSPDLTVTTLPWVHDMDGFFIAALQRR